MLNDETVGALERAVDACNAARNQLEEALEVADDRGRESAGDPEILEPVGEAIETWRDAQKRFMDRVAESEAPDPSTAALLLKTNHGIDSTEARRGIPGTSVDGADQAFDVDMSGVRGSVLTEATMDYVDE